MGDFRIIANRDEQEEGCEEECGHCCGTCQSASVDEEGNWRPGTIVKSVLTGEDVMVLKYDPDNPPSYVVRTKSYGTIPMLVFELAEK